MPGYLTMQQTVSVGGIDYLVRSLLDSQQYSDPLGEAEGRGISPASWSLFGLLWPSARVLALLMHSEPLAGLKVLEIGAGLALASMVIHRRAGDVTVTDWHPRSPDFLRENLQLNHLPPLEYQAGDWGGSNPALGRFDLIIGSDVLYERQQPGLLAHFIDRHATGTAEIVIVDPDRGNRTGFCREMTALGYGFKVERAPSKMESGEAYKGCIVRLSRQRAQAV
ncbi:SAM-dependent methyltransferase [Aquitalea magnusonii]|jgi:2-polyprenyl-3-methyl-5-hydroxy-6-metoxy-1,4-benzoquinol methylase|uniref:Calmodulin-lysine N-methyltransferase n=1 Tax=Aquitalea magnusonii TaxID=332411 RepID=A0A3G9GJW1_9NEIS|nr:SAM-dependent methyltransferase [Aquitalea magnusonii]BBF85807.1 SAM-dependent methyltransferase [Aquitalea magnusonii]